MTGAIIVVASQKCTVKHVIFTIMLGVCELLVLLIKRDMKNNRKIVYIIIEMVSQNVIKVQLN